MDVGAQRLLRPGGIDLAGGHVFDVVPERYGHVLGAGGRPAQVNGDLVGDDRGGQDQRAAIHDGALARRRTAREQLVNGDEHVLQRFGEQACAVLVHRGNHIQRLKTGDGVENLHAFHIHGKIALLFRVNVAGGIGKRCTLRFQRERFGRAGNGNRLAQGGGTGGKLGSGTVGKGDGHLNVRDGIRLGSSVASELEHPGAGVLNGGLLHKKLLSETGGKGRKGIARTCRPKASRRPCTSTYSEICLHDTGAASSFFGVFALY